MRPPNQPNQLATPQEPIPGSSVISNATPITLGILGTLVVGAFWTGTFITNLRRDTDKNTAAISAIISANEKTSDAMEAIKDVTRELRSSQDDASRRIQWLETHE